MSPKSPWIAAHIAVLFFGLSAPIAVYIGLGAVELSFTRSFLAGLILMALASRKNSWGFKSFLLSAPKGLILAFHWVAFFHVAIQASVQWALLSYATYPLWTVGLKALKNKDTPSCADLLKSSLIIIGTALLINVKKETLSTQHMILGLASALAFSVLQIANYSSPKEKSTMSLAGEQMFWASMFLTPFLSLDSVAETDVAWALLGFHALVLTALAYGLFLWALRKIGENESSFIAALEPLYGILFAIVFMGLKPEPLECIGALLILTPSFWRNGSLEQP